jgi:hypothetical protein
MLTACEQKIIGWLRKVTTATMTQIRHEFEVSHMTVVRALKKFGYYASYNYNASYYVLRDVPAFDDWGLWAYRDVRFSRYRTLPATIVALVTAAPAGLTVQELEDRLQTKAANLVSTLAHRGQVQSEGLPGRRAVYLATDPGVRAQQLELRQRPLQRESSGSTAELPFGCSALQVIAILRAMILQSDDDANHLARSLQARGNHVTAGQVHRVLDHYGIKKKRRP